MGRGRPRVWYIRADFLLVGQCGMSEGRVGQFGLVGSRYGRVHDNPVSN